MSYPKIREARYSELPAISHVLAKAFWDDPFIGAQMNPHRDEYPQDVDLGWLRKARVNFWNYRWRFVVAVDKDPASGKDVVVGVAQWSRKGDGGKKMECWWFSPRNLLKPASSAVITVSSLIWPNRACDPAKENIMEKSYPFIKHMWSGKRAESWYLELLAVTPGFQGKGAGRLLVNWGLDRAEKEGVCASVISAAGKEPFYQKCGFDVQEGSVGMGEGNPFADMEGGLIFWKMA